MAQGWSMKQLHRLIMTSEAYRAVIYGTPDGGPPTAPSLVSLAELFVGSIILFALATIFFKRVEPHFAKVL